MNIKKKKKIVSNPSWAVTWKAADKKKQFISRFKTPPENC